MAVRVGAIYLLSGFGGSILSCLFLQNSISVGASGALFGLLGAMLSELLTNWTIYTNKVVSVGAYLCLCLFYFFSFPLFQNWRNPAVGFCTAVYLSQVPTLFIWF